MDQLIKELTEMLHKTSAAFKQLIVDQKICAGERKANENKSSELDDRAKEIVRLENKFKRIEDLETYEKTLKARAKRLKEDITKHDRAVSALEIEKNMAKAEAGDQMKIAKDWQEKLRKEQKAFDAEKITYKEDIQKTIAKQLKDRGIVL